MEGIRTLRSKARKEGSEPSMETEELSNTVRPQYFFEQTVAAASTSVGNQDYVAASGSGVRNSQRCSTPDQDMEIGTFSGDVVVDEDLDDEESDYYDPLTEVVTNDVLVKYQKPRLFISKLMTDTRITETQLSTALKVDPRGINRNCAEFDDSSLLPQPLIKLIVEHGKNTELKRELINLAQAFYTTYNIWPTFLELEEWFTYFGDEKIYTENYDKTRPDGSWGINSALASRMVKEGTSLGFCYEDLNIPLNEGVNIEDDGRYYLEPEAAEIRAELKNNGGKSTKHISALRRRFRDKINNQIPVPEVVPPPKPPQLDLSTVDFNTFMTDMVYGWESGDYNLAEYENALAAWNEVVVPQNQGQQPPTVSQSEEAETINYVHIPDIDTEHPSDVLKMDDLNKSLNTSTNLDDLNTSVVDIKLLETMFDEDDSTKWFPEPTLKHSKMWFEKRQPMAGYMGDRKWEEINDSMKGRIIADPDESSYYVLQKLVQSTEKSAQYCRTAILREDLRDFQIKISRDGSMKHTEFCIPLSNRFEILTDIETEYINEGPGVDDDLVTRRRIRHSIYAKKQFEAGAVSAKNTKPGDKNVPPAVDKRTPNFKTYHHVPRKHASVEDRVKKHLAAQKRLENKIRLMTKEDVVEYIVTNKMLGVTFRAIKRYHPNLFDFRSLLCSQQMAEFMASAVLLRMQKNGGTYIFCRVLASD